MAVLCWHLLAKQKDYAWSRPALHAKKLRDLELKAGFPTQTGGNKRGTAYACNFRHVREHERRFVEQAERAYQRFVTGWQPKGSGRRTGATKERAS